MGMSERVEEVCWALRDVKWKAQAAWEKKGKLSRGMITFLALVICSIPMFWGLFARMTQALDGVTLEWHVANFSGVRAVILGMIFIFFESAEGTIDKQILKFDGAYDAVLLTGVNDIWEYLFIIGAGMVIIYFIYEINHVAFMQGSDMTLKSIGVPFIKLVCCIAFLNYGKEIVSAFLGLNNLMVDWMDDQSWAFATVTETPDGAGIVDGIEAAVEDMGFFDCIFFIVLMILAMILQWVGGLAISFQAYSRKLEMCLRMAVTPLALGDIYQDGMKSNGVRQFKRILGLCLYGGMMIAIIKFGSGMIIGQVAATFTDGFLSDILVVGAVWGLIKGFLQICIILLAEVGACSLAKQAVMDALGC